MRLNNGYVLQLLHMANEYAGILSGCTKVTVGSVIVGATGNVMALGANRAMPNTCNTSGCARVLKYGDNSKEHRLPSDCNAIHSEIDAICHLQSTAAFGSIIITRYPCEACARAIVAAGISHVYYGRAQTISEITAKIFLEGNVEVIHMKWDKEDVMN